MGMSLHHSSELSAISPVTVFQVLRFPAPTRLSHFASCYHLQKSLCVCKTPRVTKDTYKRRLKC